MGDYGINNSLEYTELALDSWDASGAGNGYFENSTAPINQLEFSWPNYFFTSKKLNVAAIKVLSAEIPFVFDVITTANNTFIYTENATAHVLTIPVGTYTGTQLAIILQTLFQTITPGFLVSWNSTLIKFEFTQPTAIPWSLSFASNATAYSPLGFMPETTTTAVTGLNSKIISTIIAQVSGPYYLYLNSRKIGSLVNFNLPDGSQAKGIGPEICRIPINVQYGSIIFYQDVTPEKFFDFFAATQFDTFDLYLTLGSDQYQKPVDMKGSPWSVKLGLLVYRNSSEDLYGKAVGLRNGGVTRIFN
jgi:hypothetical protein